MGYELYGYVPSKSYLLLTNRKALANVKQVAVSAIILPLRACLQSSSSSYHGESHLRRDLGAVR